MRFSLPGTGSVSGMGSAGAGGKPRRQGRCGFFPCILRQVCTWRAGADASHPTSLASVGL